MAKQEKKAFGSFIKNIYGARTSYIMLAPYAILFIVFILLPVLVSVFLSFTNFNMLQMPRWVGLENFTQLFFSDDIFPIAVTNTLVLALVTGPIGYLLSFVLAWSINDLKPKVRSVATLMFYTPTLASNMFFIWKFIFSNDAYGIVNSWLITLGIAHEPINWLSDSQYGIPVMIVVLLWTSASMGFLAFVAGLQSLNMELYEASAIDGIRNRWQELWYVTLPQMMPQLLLGAVFTISGSFAIGPQCAALTGMPSTDYSTHTVLLHITDYAFTRYEFGYASAIQLVLFAAMLSVWYFVSKFMSKWSTD